MIACESNERRMQVDKAPFYVWRRSDGYVSSTRYPPLDYPGQSFEMLLVTTNWPEAREKIKAERAGQQT
jgi:hypothetical protein